MPTYEYSCLKCGAQFDYVQSMADAPLKVCARERCPHQPWRKGRVKRVIGAGGGLIFKGSGFYVTDYRSPKYQEAAKKDAPPTAAPSTPESKPASAPKPAATGTK